MGKGLFKRQRRAQVKLGPGVVSVSPGRQWQVLQDLVEQLVQLEEEDLIRLEPPPMPKQEIIFCGSGAPHSGQTTSLSLPAATRHSNRRPHLLQTYSYIGMTIIFYRNHS
jgi:hypothetical protein